MPELKQKTSLIITLYNRCRKHNCLPYPGSLLEQPSWIMRLFDAIDGAIENYRRELEDEKRRNDVLKAQEAELNKRIAR